MMQGVDQTQQQQLKNLWKIYGRETKLGRQLFAMYNKSDKPKIAYPKVRPKSEKQIQIQKQKSIINKKCPQKTIIQYPQLPKTSQTKFYPIDFIPKKKNQSAIRKQIEQYKKAIAQSIPTNRGVDRQNLVRKLQQKFKTLGGILPKDATLPNLQSDFEYNEKQIKQKASQRLQKKYKTYQKPQVHLPQHQKQQKKPQSLTQQLDILFQQIVQQIDDRQKYLDSIQHLQQPDLKNKIKRQMIQRIAELQKITQFKKN